MNLNVEPILINNCRLLDKSTKILDKNDLFNEIRFITVIIFTFVIKIIFAKNKKQTMFEII